MNKQAIEQIVSFWKNEHNIPFKGALVSFDEIERGKEPVACMCAQGQVLHKLDNWEPEELETVDQFEADQKVAELLGISVAHSILLRTINDTQRGAPSDVLTNPEKYLGVHYQKVLDFWTLIDNLTVTELDAISTEVFKLSSQNMHLYQCELSNKLSELDKNYHRIGETIAQSIGPRIRPFQVCGGMKMAGVYATYEIMNGKEETVYLKLFVGS